MGSTASVARPARSILVAGALALLLVVAAVLAALLLGAREPEQFPAGTPEGTFQRYWEAWEDRDAETAYGYLSERARRQVSLDQYAWAFSSQGGYPVEENMRIRIAGVEAEGDRATLYLTVERFYDSGIGFDSNRYTEEHRIRLAREGDGWKIDEPLVGLYPGHFPPPATPTA